MSDKNLMLDHEISWDKNVDEIEEYSPQVFSEFGSMQYIGNKKVRLFQSGERVEFPNFLFNGETFSRGGMKEGHVQGDKNNAIAHFIAFYGKRFDNDENWASVQVFTNKPQIPVDAGEIDAYPVISLTKKQQEQKNDGKTVWLADWSNLQFPALREGLTKKQTETFTKGERLYYKADLWNTGSKPREDNQGRVDDKGNPRKYYDRYRFNFTIYETEDAMLAAREEYKKESDNENGKEDFWPASWVESNSVQGMIDHAKTVEGTHAEIATALMLTDAKTVNGEDVNISLVLSKCLDMPEPMIKL